MSKSNSISLKNKNDLVVSDTELNTILDNIYDGGIPHIVIRDTLKIKLRTFHRYLEQNPKFKEEFEKAQEIGIKTLVEKMLDVFSIDRVDLSPNELMFLKEKQSYLKWLAPRVSSLFQEKQNLNVKSDSNIKISWEDSSDNLIDVSAEEVSTPTSEGN